MKKVKKLTKFKKKMMFKKFSWFFFWLEPAHTNKKSETNFTAYLFPDTTYYFLAQERKTEK